jgi:hypothetical protein
MNGELKSSMYPGRETTVVLLILGLPDPPVLWHRHRGSRRSIAALVIIRSWHEKTLILNGPG